MNPSWASLAPSATKKSRRTISRRFRMTADPICAVPGYQQASTSNIHFRRRDSIHNGGSPMLVFKLYVGGSRLRLLKMIERGPRRNDHSYETPAKPGVLLTTGRRGPGSNSSRQMAVRVDPHAD